MTALKKTNAMRLLEQAKVPFEFYEYETTDGKIDAKSVAAKIGQAPEQVFKTLVTQSPTHEHFVFVVPSIGELDGIRSRRMFARRHEKAVSDVHRRNGSAVRQILHQRGQGRRELELSPAGRCRVFRRSVRRFAQRLNIFTHNIGCKPRSDNRRQYFP